MKLSILTATYNRGNLLPNLYKSIIKNKKSNLELEWIIIDDGSTDDTSDIVSNFILQKNLEIKYIYQENQGKMNAINKGANISTGDLIIDCDSDDYFSKNAFQNIEKNANILKQNNGLYGLCFLKQNKEGKISGNKFEKNYMETTMFNLYFKQNANQGEKILVFNGNIRRKYKHEIEENEKFITEARMYHKMDEKYKIMCINEVIEIGDYIEDGYTKNIQKIFDKYPKGYYKYFKEIFDKGLKGVTLKKRLYIIKNLLLFEFKARKRREE